MFSMFLQGKCLFFSSSRHKQKSSKLLISRQAFYKMMNEKESFSIDDAIPVLWLLHWNRETSNKIYYACLSITL